MVNPFEDVVDTPQSEGGVGGSLKIAKIFGDATEEAKQSALAEASSMAKAAHSINSQMNMARKTGNSAWMQKLRAAAQRLGAMLWDFIKKAVELAVFKLVIELCAMIMNSVLDALTKRGNQKMDITTPGVFFQPKTATGSTTTQTSSYSPGSNPFDYRSASGISPW